MDHVNWITEQPNVKLDSLLLLQYFMHIQNPKYTIKSIIYLVISCDVLTAETTYQFASQNEVKRNLPGLAMLFAQL